MIHPIDDQQEKALRILYDKKSQINRQIKLIKDAQVITEQTLYKDQQLLNETISEKT